MEQVAFDNKRDAARTPAVSVKARREDLIILHVFAGQSYDVLAHMFRILHKAAVVPMDFAFTRERKTVIIKMHVDRKDVPKIKRILNKVEVLPTVTLVDLLDNFHQSLLTVR